MQTKAQKKKNPKNPAWLLPLHEFMKFIQFHLKAKKKWPKHKERKKVILNILRESLPFNER